MKDIILYHGSKSGIAGDIRPSSRRNCDFGQGFYMGESANYAKAFVSAQESPVLYKLKLKASEIPEDRILRLDGIDWLYTVLACRGGSSNFSTQFNQLSAAKEALARTEKYDLIIGKIADDKMMEAVKAFGRNGLTLDGLMYCLKFVQYGNQYVAKTPEVCRKIEILKEQPLIGKEKEDARRLGIQKQSEGREAVTKANILYLRKGLYLSELIEKELEREKTMKSEPGEGEQDYGRE
jgi:hypothetical protein